MKKYKLIKKYPSLPTDWEIGMEIGLGDRILDYSPCNSKYFDYRISNNEVENFPEYWMKIEVENKYPKIISFKRVKSDNVNHLNEIFTLNEIGSYKSKFHDDVSYKFNSLMHEGYCVDSGHFIIYQVQISDTKILTVGDKIVWDWRYNGPYITISKFYMNNNDLKFDVSAFFYDREHSIKNFDLNYITMYNIRHYIERAPLFISEDNVKIYEGDNYWFYWINKHVAYACGQLPLTPYQVTARKLMDNEKYSSNARFFSTYEAIISHLDTVQRRRIDLCYKKPISQLSYDLNTIHIQARRSLNINQYINGKKEGYWEEYYHSNGNLEAKGNYKDEKEDGYWEGYYENGKLYFKGNYKDGEREGYWEWYHDNGNIASKGNYKNGKVDGYWEGYDENGNLRSKGNYKDGKVDGY